MRLLRDRDRASPLNGATSPRPSLSHPLGREATPRLFLHALPWHRTRYFHPSEEDCAMKNWKLGLAILAVPAVMFACKRSPAEKKAEINKEMTQEERDHAKDTREIAKDETNPTERTEELQKEQ